MSTTNTITQTIQILSIGKVSRDFIIPFRGKPVSDIPGGSALYCAVGAAIWKKDRIGVVARVGNDYPFSILDSLTSYNIDLRGVRILPRPLDVRAFHSSINKYSSRAEPISHYSNQNFDFPRVLLGYKIQVPLREPRKTNTSISKMDFPPDYLQASGAHICSSDGFSQVLIATLLQTYSLGIITMHISDIELDIVKSEQFISTLNNLTCIMINTQALKKFIGSDSDDRSALIKGAARLGSELVVILLGNQGRILLDNKSGKKWFIPLYPVDDSHTVGIDDSFCGGFVTALRFNYDPLESVIYGAISASIVSQGIGLEYAFHSSPEFLNARVKRLRGRIRKI